MPTTGGYLPRGRGELNTTPFPSARALECRAPRLLRASVNKGINEKRKGRWRRSDSKHGSTRRVTRQGVSLCKPPGTPYISCPRGHVLNVSIRHAQHDLAATVARLEPFVCLGNLI